ncbi:MAG TPA: DUF6522 family protein [Amaricoccus sp.]|uniref:DUF6522 family protein n=1 Tax=Amaricoccus sp. TaxID=1872485 RepID=UPI002B7C78B3|nr:DUF6522 family protein [Amaricoccus sp.]HMQ91662.1 DUF6522 family protein [Amaricoccus sp.]HMR52235.1 DUF6522 family protein [Amaricoccus sp.]HMT99087.1 DUF6522 family protein [Amaricoccus sp.]
MSTIERNGSDFVVSAGLLASAFGLSEEAVRQGMRANRITSQSETGVGEDEGRWRLTFFFQDRAVRFIVDEHGQVLKRVGFPIRQRTAQETRAKPKLRRE